MLSQHQKNLAAHNRKHGIMSLIHRFHGTARHLRALPVRYLAVVIAVHTAVVLGLGAVVDAMVDAAMSVAGISGLTEGTAVDLARSPAAVALMIGVIVIVAVATLAYTTIIVAVAELQLSGAAPSVRALFRRTLLSLKTLCRPGATLVALLLVVVAPVAGFGLFSPLTASLALPPFIVRELVKTIPGAVGWTLVIVVLLYVTFRTSLAVPLSVVAGTRPGQSLRTSIGATGRYGIPLALLLAASFGALWAVSRVLTEILGQLVDAAAPVLPDIELAITVASLALTLLSLLGAVFTAFLLVEHARELSGVVSRPAPAGPVARHPSADIRRRSRVARHPAFIGVAAAAVVAIAGATVAYTSAAYAGIAGTAIVIGHRGYDSGGVENTVGALEAAVAFAPDFVEVDVQQAGDGGFIASHDTNLLVLAGINTNVYDMTTAEVTATTVRMKGNSGTIPTMATFVTRAAQLEMPLLIEFKLHGHEEPGFIADALAELDALGVLASNTYQSTSPLAVAEIKRLHPELRVGFTIGLLRGEVPMVDCDFYTLEQASYNSEFLNTAHARGREVYIWTVNDSLTMRSLLRDGVDGLVTDRIDTAQRYAARITHTKGYSPGDARDQLLADFTWD